MKRLLNILAFLTILSVPVLAQGQQTAPKPGPSRTQGIFPEGNVPEEFQQVGSTDFYASRASDAYDLLLHQYSMYYSTAWRGYITCLKVDEEEAVRFDYYLQTRREELEQYIAALQNTEEPDLENIEYYQNELNNINGRQGVCIDDISIAEYTDGSIRVEYSVKNSSDKTHSFSFGTYANSGLGETYGTSCLYTLHDDAGNAIGLELRGSEGTNQGLSILYQWSVAGGTPVDNYWFGGYTINNDYERIAGDYAEIQYDEEGNPYDHYYEEGEMYDVGIGWCWKNRTLAAGETQTFSIVIGYTGTPQQMLPDAAAVAFSLADHDIEAGSSVNATVTIENQGQAALPAHTDITYFINYGHALTTYYTQEEIGPGESLTLTHSLPITYMLGEWRVQAVVNDTYSVQELFHENNYSDYDFLTVHAPFTATLHTDKSTYQQGDTVYFSGHLTGADVAYREVEIFVNNDGRFTLTANADANGDFSYRFIPSEGQVGHFVAGASFPGINSYEYTCEFNIYGLQRDDISYFAYNLEAGIPLQSNLMIYNPGVLDVTDIKVNILSKPADCQITFGEVALVAAGESAAIPFEILSTTPTEGNQWQPVKFEVTSAEGAHFITDYQ